MYFKKYKMYHQRPCSALLSLKIRLQEPLPDEALRGKPKFTYEVPYKYKIYLLPSLILCFWELRKRNLKRLRRLSNISRPLQNLMKVTLNSINKRNQTLNSTDEQEFIHILTKESRSKRATVPEN